MAAKPKVLMIRVQTHLSIKVGEAIVWFKYDPDHRPFGTAWDEALAKAAECARKVGRKRFDVIEDDRDSLDRSGRDHNPECDGLLRYSDGATVIRCPVCKGHPAAILAPAPCAKGHRHAVCPACLSLIGVADREGCFPADPEWLGAEGNFKNVDALTFAEPAAPAPAASAPDRWVQITIDRDNGRRLLGILRGATGAIENLRDEYGRPLDREGDLANIQDAVGRGENALEIYATRNDRYTSWGSAPDRDGLVIFRLYTWRLIAMQPANDPAGVEICCPYCEDHPVAAIAGAECLKGHHHPRCPRCNSIIGLDGKAAPVECYMEAAHIRHLRDLDILPDPDRPFKPVAQFTDEDWAIANRGELRLDMMREDPFDGFEFRAIDGRLYRIYRRAGAIIGLKFEGRDPVQAAKDEVWDWLRCN